MDDEKSYTYFTTDENVDFTSQMIESYREEIARNAKEAKEAFQRGELKPQPLEDIINELKAKLTEDE